MAQTYNFSTPEAGGSLQICSQYGSSSQFQTNYGYIVRLDLSYIHLLHPQINNAFICLVLEYTQFHNC